MDSSYIRRATTLAKIVIPTMQTSALHVTLIQLFLSSSWVSASKNAQHQGILVRSCNCAMPATILVFNVKGQVPSAPNAEWKTSFISTLRLISASKSVLMACLKTQVKTCVSIAMKTAKLAKTQLIRAQVATQLVNGLTSSTTTASAHVPL